MVSSFGAVFIYLIVGIIIVMLLLGISKLIAPHHPNELKNSSYECGEPVVGSAWIPVNAKYYVVALIFLLFEVEIVFIFPWSVIFGDKSLLIMYPNFGWIMLIEMTVFISILLLGLLYVWKAGDLSWVSSVVLQENVSHSIPLSAYDNINNISYSVQPFANVQKIDTATLEEKSNSDTTVSETHKPAYKPMFRKPSA